MSVLVSVGFVYIGVCRLIGSLRYISVLVVLSVVYVIYRFICRRYGVRVKPMTPQRGGQPLGCDLLASLPPGTRRERNKPMLLQNGGQPLWV